MKNLAAEILTVTLLGLGVALTGCVPEGNTFERDLVAAAAGGEEFEIPQQSAPGGSWDRFLVLCPYAQISDDLDSGFKKEAKRLDTTSNENLQWLLFGSTSKVTSLGLSRDDTDFCSGNTPLKGTFSPNSRWTAEFSHGTWNLQPKN